MTHPNNFHTHYRTCNLCEAMCGLEIVHRNGDILSVKGDVDDPFSRGHICPKAVALTDIYNDPDRLKQPVRRTKSGWQRVPWDEALDEVADRLKQVQGKHGNNAVAFYQGNPTVHNSGTMLFAPLFLKALRTQNRFSATSVDQLPHHFAAYFMFGHQLLLPIPDIDRTKHLLILGANPLASNGSLMTAPGFADRLNDLQKRGGRCVVVDPRRTETAAKADAHHFIRPGADALFLLGLLNTLFSENLVNRDELPNYLAGVDSIAQLVADFPPERCAETTGIDAPTIRKLARDFAAADSAVCYGRFGVSTQQFGAVCQWLINVLNTVTGNLDRPGGAMFTLPGIDTIQQTAKQGRVGHYAKWTSRVRGLPEFGGELPVAVMAEEILTEGDGQIRALVTSAGNPVLSTPNGTQLDRALQQLEFMVSIDIYINETTRHADIILPPATGLETDHYDLAFHILAVRNTAKYSTALFQPANDAKYDWQIFDELRKRLSKNGRSTGIAANLKRKIADSMTPERMLDLGLRLGPYGVWGGRLLSSRGLSLRKLKNNPHGIDLGALKPCLPQRLFTTDKTVHLAPEPLMQDVERVITKLSAASSATPDLLLIGRRDLRSNNSWMHNSERLVKGKVRCTLLMHPQDAAARGISDGQRVEVSSRVGKISIPVELTEQIMPGVVSIPHGWGHDRDGVQLQTATKHAGQSINDLTDDATVDELSGNAAFSGVPVVVNP